MELEQPTIAVFGSSRPEPGSEAYELAYQVGRVVAQSGCRLVNGGYGGTMEAGAKGAAEAGGRTAGVTCRAFRRSGANPWIQEVYETDTLGERLEMLLELGDAYVVVPGSTGTLLEIAMAWELMNKRFLPERPIIFMTDFWRPVVETITGTGEAKANFLRFCQDLHELRRECTNLVTRKDTLGRE